MSKLNTNRKLTSLDDMFGGFEPEVDEVVQTQDETGHSGFLPIAKLHPKKNHKFQVNLGKKNQDLLQSIKEFGVLEPIIVQPLGNEYEILAGHRRTAMAQEAGLQEIPAVIKTGLTEAEADLIETETNLLQRSWADMSHSERAEVINAHYNATNFQGVRKGFLEQINEEIKSLANPVNSMADEGLSPMGTKGNLRDAGDAYELSKNTVGRYLRIYTLTSELKDRMDMDEIALRAGVEISYLTEEHQQQLDDLLDAYKVDIKKAQDLRKLEMQGKLNEDSMKDILSGKQLKKPGRPKAFKIQGMIIQKYFKEGTRQKEIEEVIEAALEAYFKKEG
ncbi:MAG: ParB N-terminal domain-containing protein [Lachnospiraceae bacterium]|nr:ParB N-terminal domain-containing protein [Lachnospiraceae bacterium]